MTTEHVSVPRELLEELMWTWKLEAKAHAEKGNYVRCDLTHKHADELKDILSRATPSDDCTCTKGQVCKTMTCKRLQKQSEPRVVTADVERDHLPPGWRVNEDTSTGFIEICNPKGEYIHICYLPQGSELASRLLRELAVACINTPIESFANSLPAAIPPWYVVVPVEPTDRMIDAAERLWTSEEIYKAMLAAAPQAGERG